VSSDPDLERPLRQVDLRDVGRHDLGALVLRLIAEPLHQLLAGHLLREAGVVLDVGREHELAAGDEPARAEAFDAEGLQVGARGVDGSREPRGAGADDDDVSDGALHRDALLEADLDGLDGAVVRPGEVDLDVEQVLGERVTHVARALLPRGNGRLPAERVVVANTELRLHRDLQLEGAGLLVDGDVALGVGRGARLLVLGATGQPVVALEPHLGRRVDRVGPTEPGSDVEVLRGPPVCAGDDAGHHDVERGELGLHVAGEVVFRRAGRALGEGGEARASDAPDEAGADRKFVGHDRVAHREGRKNEQRLPRHEHVARGARAACASRLRACNRPTRATRRCPRRAGRGRRARTRGPRPAAPGTPPRSAGWGTPRRCTARPRGRSPLPAPGCCCRERRAVLRRRRGRNRTTGS
jgi:hypothetical protein